MMSLTLDPVSMNGVKMLIGIFLWVVVLSILYSSLVEKVPLKKTLAVVIPPSKEDIKERKKQCRAEHTDLEDRFRRSHAPPVV